LTSERPQTDSLATIEMSQMPASSMPPPKHQPLTLAIVTALSSPSGGEATLSVL